MIIRSLNTASANQKHLALQRNRLDKGEVAQLNPHLPQVICTHPWIFFLLFTSVIISKDSEDSRIFDSPLPFYELPAIIQRWKSWIILQYCHRLGIKVRYFGKQAVGIAAYLCAPWSRYVAKQSNSII